MEAKNMAFGGIVVLDIFYSINNCKMSVPICQ
jgi:hypothetical protein